MTWAIRVRRARRDDLPALAELHNLCRPEAAPVEAHDMLLSLLETGYLLAMCATERDGQAGAEELRGALAWRAENLIACMTDFLTIPDAPVPNAAQLLESLLSAMEGHARALSCEVSLLLLDPSAEPLTDVAQRAGYAPSRCEGWPAAWKEAASHLGPERGVVFVKRLLERRITRPV